jgi:hypothetical protein
LATPLALNPAPTVFTPATVTLEFPVFVIVVGNGLLVLRLTLPNAKLVGLAAKTVVAAMEFPVNGIVSCAGEPFVERTMDPGSVPVALDGVNTASKGTLPPAGMVVAVESPVVL